jgi:CHAD domain-containing protein
MSRRQHSTAPALPDTITGLQHGLDQCLQRLEQSTNAKAIHECRVAARKLAVVVRALRRRPLALATKRISRALKHLLQDLGPARDADVRMLTLRSASSHAPLLALAAAQQRRQRRDLSNLTKTVRWARRRDILHRASSALAKHLRTAPPSQGAILKIILRRNRSLRRRLRRNPASSEKTHRLRLRIKELRYLLEILGPARTDLNCIDTNLLKRLQRRIGDFRDLWGAAQWMRLTISADPKLRRAAGQPRLQETLRSAEARMRRQLTVISRSV